MGIHMWVRSEMSERGERIDESELIWRVPSEVLDPVRTPLLAGVDPYGDTVFNRLQVRHQLPVEIAYLRQRLTGPDETAMLDEVERLMAVATERVHRYLWFIGD